MEKDKIVDKLLEGGILEKAPKMPKRIDIAPVKNSWGDFENLVLNTLNKSTSPALGDIGTATKLLKKMGKDYTKLAAMLSRFTPKK